MLLCLCAAWRAAKCCWKGKGGEATTLRLSLAQVSVATFVAGHLVQCQKCMQAEVLARAACCMLHSSGTILSRASQALLSSRRATVSVSANNAAVVLHPGDMLRAQAHVACTKMFTESFIL